MIWGSLSYFIIINLKFSLRLIEIFSKHFFLSNKNVNTGLRSFLFSAYFLKLTVLGKSRHFFPRIITKPVYFLKQSTLLQICGTLIIQTANSNNLFPVRLRDFIQLHGTQNLNNSSFIFPVAGKPELGGSGPVQGSLVL